MIQGNSCIIDHYISRQNINPFLIEIPCIEPENILIRGFQSFDGRLKSGDPSKALSSPLVLLPEMKIWALKMF